MIRIEVVIHDGDVDEDDLDYLLGELRYRVKYTDGVGSSSVNVVERDAD